MAITRDDVLFYADAAHGGKAAVGGLPDFTRAGGAWYFDRGARGRTLVRNQLRTEYVELHSGLIVPAWLLEPATKQELSAPFDVTDTGEWTHTSITVTGGFPSVFDGEEAAKTTPDATGDRIENDAGTFSGNGETAVCVVEGDPASLTERVELRIRNVTAGTSPGRIFLNISTGAVTVDTGTGSGQRLGRGPNGGPLWLLKVTAAAQTAGNDRSVWVLPDGTNGTAPVFVHYVGHEENQYGSNPLDGPAVTAQATDSALEFGSMPLNVAGYLRAAWGMPGRNVIDRLFSVTTEAFAHPRLQLFLSSADGRPRLAVTDSSGNSAEATAGVALSVGDDLELFWSVNGVSGAIRIGMRIDGGAITGANASPPAAWDSTPWSGPFRIGHPGFIPRHHRIRDVIVDPSAMDNDPLRTGDPDADVMDELAALRMTPSGEVI